MANPNPNTMFNQAIIEKWNYEADWLWLANHVETKAQQISCLEHALHINPDNTETQRQLDKLNRQDAWLYYDNNSWIGNTRCSIIILILGLAY